MLFENQKDLVRGFEEWLPRPCDCIGEHEMSIQDPVKLEERVYDLEKRVVGVENVVKGFGEANGEVEEEIVELRHEVMMLMGENKTLRDRVQQLDNYEAGPRFVAMREQQLLKKEVEEMKFENEQLKKAVAELRGCICFE
jgi:predicted RNase H-like nuclease (RuvC/YqgF family)